MRKGRKENVQFLPVYSIYRGLLMEYNAMTEDAVNFLRQVYHFQIASYLC